MTSRYICVLVLLLAVSVPCCADSPQANQISVSEYREHLERLEVASDNLISSEPSVPALLRVLPPAWHVHTEHGEFDVTTEGLRREVQRYEKEHSPDNALAIHVHLRHLRREIDGFEREPVDVSKDRSRLNSILAQREFSDVSGPTWVDRFKRWLLETLIRLLTRLFGMSSIPNISKYFVYGLMGVALAVLGYIAYRTIWRGEESAELIPTDLPVSAKEWAIWLAEGRAAAAKGEWGDAIHLAYWAGISFLERQGFWKPDRARTPREYLRLLSASSEHRETLTALTRIFELAWYAKRGASEADFSRTLAELEKLGCR
jgi:Domain of unknown function (DUF4129)